MARHKTTYGAYALEKFELPVDVRMQLRAAFERQIELEHRRAERARKAASKSRDAFWDRKKASAETVPTAFPPRPSDTDERAYVRGFTASEDELNGGERRSSDRDEIVRNKKAAERLLEVGPWRPALRLPANWRADLEALRGRFPNFGEAVDAMRAWFAIAEREASGRRLITFPPVALLGAPGIGKTMFVEALANALRVPLYRVDMASAQTSSRLAGSDEYWSNSKPGLPFEILAFAENEGIANSIVLLDEVDKASSETRHDPLGALYTLLEPRTAATFSDLAFPRISLDARHLLFIATMNDVASVPLPIMSRMRVFEIPSLDREDGLSVVRRLAEEIVRTLGLEPAALDDAVLLRLEGVAPRAARQLLQEAFGRALSAGRCELLPDDIVVANRTEPQSRIGFVWEDRQ
jgi:ATP-dependent Lon protease